jgi:hypothetical protein
LVVKNYEIDSLSSVATPGLGVNGCIKSICNCGLEVLCNNGQIDASSSVMKVDCDGDVVNDSGNWRNDGSELTLK